MKNKAPIQAIHHNHLTKVIRSHRMLLDIIQTARILNLRNIIMATEAIIRTLIPQPCTLQLLLLLMMCILLPIRDTVCRMNSQKAACRCPCLRTIRINIRHLHPATIRDILQPSINLFALHLDLLVNVFRATLGLCQANFIHHRLRSSISRSSSSSSRLISPDMVTIILK